MRTPKLLEHLRVAMAVVGATAAMALLSGCEDDVITVVDSPPAVPSGVYTITGDAQVVVEWFPVREDDVAGYGVYRNRTEDGAYDRIATIRGVENTTFTDHDVANGVTYYYAVDAFDERGNESDLSYENAFDTPRPAGSGITVQAAEVDPNRSGIDLSDWRTSGFVTAWNASDTDIYVRRINGVLYLKGTAINGLWNDIQDLGYTSSMDDVSWAPDVGWSVSPNGVELIAGHTYVIWTHDSYFAKVRVVEIGPPDEVPSAILIDWAYQVEQNNPELAPPAPVASGSFGIATKGDA